MGGLRLSCLVVEQLVTAAQEGQSRKVRNLDFLRGCWIEDREFDSAIEAQREIDSELWE